MSEKSQLFSRIAMDWSDPEQVLKVIENRKRRVRPELEANFVEPANPTHKQLAEIWIQVLGVERVGIHDNFFKLGGNSLLATQVISRIRAGLGVELGLRSLFEGPTVAELSELIRMELNKGLAVAPPIEPQERSGPVTLSYAQQRLWFLDQLEPGTPFYNLHVAFRMQGELEVAVLSRAFAEVVGRHESLRTIFTNVDGLPLQEILAPSECLMELVDLSASEAPERAARELSAAQARAAFDLSVGPLLRLKLLRLGAEEHVLLVTMHHIISDGWSMGVLIREVTTLYAAFLKGQPARLAELPVQYADFAVWQRNWLSGAVLDEQLAYWRKQLEGAPPRLELATDHPRPAVQTFNGASAAVVLPSALSKAVQQLSQGEGVTLFMTLLAVFQTLLYRYTGERDIVIGTPIANRNRAEIEELIGFFVNTLVMRTKLNGEESFRELLQRVREVVLDAHSHQDLPFEKLVEAMEPERDLSRSPMFQVMLVLQNAPRENVELPGLTLSQLVSGHKTAKFDLTMFVTEGRRGLLVSLEYNTDLFEAATMERMLGHFQTVLESVVADPDQRVSNCALMPVAEKEQLLVEWNDTAVDYGPAQTLDQLISAQVARTPDNVAVIFEDEPLTYAELDRRADALAVELQWRGVAPDVTVGICMERSVELVVALVAVLKAGGAYVPLDPGYPRERLQFMVEDAKPAVVLTRESVLAFEEGDNLASSFAPSRLCASNLAYVIYTSGSTGQPKGAMNTHAGIVNRLLWMQNQYRLTAADCVLQKTPFSFDVSVWEFFWPLITGARLVLAKPGGHQDPNYLAQLIARQQVTTIHFVPSMLQAFLATAELSQCASLERVICSGEALSFEVQQRFHETMNAELHNLYGPTEVSVDVTHWACERDGQRQIVPIGRPIANTEIYILDSAGQPVPAGVAGELMIGGVGLGRGYLKRPDLTADRFQPHPFSAIPGARLYRTGDLARYDATGQIEFLGRLDQQVKVRGFRIELGEIESALTAHSEVRECVVTASEVVPGDWGLIAYMVPVSEAPTVEGLRKYLKQRLPDYMCPTFFVTLAELPHLPNGKIDRRSLPLPSSSRPELTREFVSPRNEIESELAKIWIAVLRVERVGVHDNFFELGGHSLLATQVISRIRAGLGVELGLRSLFEGPTVAELSELIRMELNKGLAVAPPIEPQERSGPVTLSYAQQRLWFLDQLEPGTPFYNLHVAFRMQGELEVAVLSRAFAEVVGRHESLRTIFTNVDGLPLQEILAPSECLMELVDLSASEAPERAARELSAAQARAAFDLSVGPLLRLKLLRLGAEEHVLLVTMHHIISDGWSMGVLIREVTTLYAAFLKGQPARLAELPVQYADFAVWQRNWLSGAVLDEQLEYWRKQLEGAPPRLELATDHPRPAVQTFNGASVAVVLPSALSEAVQQLSQGEGVTLFMTLLAVFQTLLYRYTGERDIVIGTPIANRNRAEIEELIGFFVNTLVMRTKLSGEESFRELLQRVREVVLDAHSHQDLPFEKLVEALEPERDLSRSPMFQVMLVLQNAPRENVELPGLTLSQLVSGHKTAKFDLTMFVTEGRRGLLVSLEYNTDLFEAATMERMLGHFKVLLEAVVQEPEAKLRRLPLLTSVEQQLLAEWNETRSGYLRERCIHQLFTEQAERTPDNIALVCKGEELTYRELNERANQLAHYLQRRGVNTETLVGVCLERSIEMVTALLAILKAGGAYVPLDPQYPQARLAYILEEAATPIVLTQEHLSKNLPRPQSETFFSLDSAWDQLAEYPTSKPGSDVTPANLAYVIYTSGSTGHPKGVQIQHESAIALIDWAQRTFRAESFNGVLASTSICFDLSVFELFVPLSIGGTIVLAQNALQLLELESPVPVTMINTVPSAMSELVRMRAVPASVSVVNLAGEALSPRLAQDVYGLEQVESLYNLYGPSEDTTYSTWELVERIEQANVPIGRPVSNTRVYVVDEGLQIVPVGVSGELLLGGEGLARGYLKRAELTAERFIPDPFSGQPGEQLYRTGDLCRYKVDGRLEYLGRLDHQVKVRGYRVELGEIEAVLSGHEQVSEAVVIAREERLVAYVVSEAETAELRRYLQQRLPKYMIPSAWMKLDALPLTTNGKVDRRALPTPGATTRIEDEDTYVAPRTPIEAGLASIWSEVLKIDRIGIHDNFFAHGGHSLLATQMIARLRNVYNVDVPLRRFFESPTVAGLAVAVVQEQASKVDEDQMAELIAELEYLSDDDAISQVSS